MIPMQFTHGVEIHKAAPIGDQIIPNLMLRATEAFPEPLTTMDASILHQRNAEKLGEAIVKTLPGGTIDRLLIFLLEHRASVLRVAHPDLRAEGKES